MLRLHKLSSHLFWGTLLPIMAIIPAVCCSAESINTSSTIGAGTKIMKIVAMGDSTIDVFGRFEAYDQVENQSIHDLLIPEDEMHPNDLGHAMIAQWLADLLLDEIHQP